MARPQNRKRERAKLSGERNFSPAFWDNLSRVSVTTRALRELDRRNKAHSRRTVIPEVYPTQLARFARHGGPDLCRLRSLTKHTSAPLDMRSHQSSTSAPGQPQSTNTTGLSSRSETSSAYGKDFQEHLADYNIHMNNRGSKARNATEIRSELSHERASLSPSQFSESAFEEFRSQSQDAAFENEVMASVLPTLCGNSDIPSKQNVLFTELKPITNTSAVKLKPDFFDGSNLRDLHQSIRTDELIRSTAIPTKHPQVPVVPNFFLEVNGPSGSAAVAQWQACYDGAHGSRAIHALQNYKETEPIYDGNAYTYSSTYNTREASLRLYAHHVTAPATANEKPEYHMTEIDGWQMTGNINSFRRGATAFRNARDSAERHRNRFIQAANARATQVVEVLQVDDARTQEDPNNSPSPNESRDDAAYMAWKDADDALQQQLAFQDGTGATTPCINEASRTPSPPTLSKEPTKHKRSRDSTSLPFSKRTNLSMN